MPLEVKRDYIKIMDKRMSMNLSYFYKTPFVCGDFFVAEGIYQSENGVVCADLTERTWCWKEYKIEDHLSFLELKFPKYINENRIITSFSGALYEYLDEDKVVENAYILLNGENVKEISTKSGNTTITGLDFENASYEIKLVIEYLDEAEKVIKVESDTLEYKVVTPEPQPQPEKPKGGCGKKGVELFISLMAASAVIGILLRKRK